MSVTSGFFNSLNHDRRYNAKQMSAIFDGIINDGVFANIGVAFKVNADAGVTINIGEGKAWFTSAWVYNDALLPMTLEGSEVVLDRIDAVVIDVDHNDSVRLGSIKVIKGTPSSSPKRPTMVSDRNHSQHPLAYIYRKAGSTEITQADITNMVGTSSCPYITGILQVQNIDNIVAQWNAQWNQWYAEKIAETDTDTSELMAEMKSEFDIWFNDIQALLEDDVATALAAQVAELQGKFDDLARESAVYDDIENSDLDPILGSDGTPIQGKTVLGGSANTEDIDLSGYAKQADLEKVKAAKLDRTEKFAVNLLDNSDFTNPVNQRGDTTYANDKTARKNTIDRWWLWDNGYSLTVQDGYITVVGKLFQVLEHYKPNTVYTMALKHVDGTLTIRSHTFENGSGAVDKSEFFLVSGETRIQIGSGDYLWVALYEGEYTAETLPAYRPKGYGAELAECQRYYIVASARHASGTYSSSGNKFHAFVPTPVTMRVTPTISILLAETIVSVTYPGGTAKLNTDTAQSVAATELFPNGVKVTFNTSLNPGAYTQGAFYGNFNIEMSADL